MIEKMGKKEKKKLKAIQKNLQGSLKTNNIIKEQPNKMKTQVKYFGIPQIKIDDRDNGQEKQSQLRVTTKNKKIITLKQEIVRSLENCTKVQIIGDNLQIPKAISLVEIIKRELINKNRDFQQDNVLGVSEKYAPCIKITLDLKKQTNVLKKNINL